MDQTSVWEGRILDAQVLLQETKTKLREERVSLHVHICMYKGFSKFL